MYFDAVKTIDLCAKLKLTVNQFTFCYLVYTQQVSLFIKYHHEVGGFSDEEVSVLVKRGMVIDTNRRGERYADRYIVQDEFTSNFIDALDNDLGMEIWDNYPTKIHMTDMSFNGRNISPEECEMLIKKKLLTGRIESKEAVLRALEEQKNEGRLTMAIKKWIESEQWKEESSEDNSYGNDYIQ